MLKSGVKRQDGLGQDTDHAIFFQRLTVTTDVRAKVRYRGIYDVPVYRADVNLTGTFGALDFGDMSNHHIMWDKADSASASPTSKRWSTIRSSVG